MEIVDFELVGIGPGSLTPLLVYTVFHLPELVVCLIGALLAVKFWRRHPRVSLLVLIAMCIALGYRLVGHVELLYLALSGVDYPVRPSPFSLYGLFQVLNSVVRATVFGLLIVAAFGWRHQPRQMPPIDKQG